jgi:Ca2+-binding RTX toxin-like protein
MHRRRCWLFSNDTINAGEGDNWINAGEGTNTVTAGSGNDTIVTGAGDDTIRAGDGNNAVYAGDGANDITTGSGADYIVADRSDLDGEVRPAIPGADAQHSAAPRLVSGARARDVRVARLLNDE